MDRTRQAESGPLDPSEHAPDLDGVPSPTLPGHITFGVEVSGDCSEGMPLGNPVTCDLRDVRHLLNGFVGPPDCRALGPLGASLCGHVPGTSGRKVERLALLPPILHPFPGPPAL